MPAKKKYLHQSSWAKTGKFTAALLGGLFASIGIHMALALWLDPRIVISTTLWSMFLVWPAMMLIVYWIKKPWVSWAVMLGLTVVSGLFIFLGKM
ncbi:MAG: hypothetical protein AAF694_28520 [Bacteroidota bacterium]